MEMYIISKVVSLKMKTLIFAVTCTYLNLNYHKEDTFRQILSQFRGSCSSCPSEENEPNVIFMVIPLYSVFHIVIYRAFVHIKEKYFNSLSSYEI